MSFDQRSDAISNFFANILPTQFPEVAHIEVFPEDDWRQQGPFDYIHTQLQWSQSQRRRAMVDLEAAWYAFVLDLFTDETSLENFQELCEDLDISPVPENKSHCERELKRLHVNLVDVIQLRWDKRLGKGTGTVTRYRNKRELKEATEDEQKVLPGDIGKIGVLKFLLR